MSDGNNIDLRDLLYAGVFHPGFDLDFSEKIAGGCLCTHGK
jgi:hypothetical protein